MSGEPIVGPRSISNGESILVFGSSGDWLLSWHPPDEAPFGTPHGANAFCLSDRGEVVLVTEDGKRFGWPGGRPQGDETWEQTLRREIVEECCCSVSAARLLGFVRAECVEGAEAGDVLIRSIWVAVVNVHEWRADHEIIARKLVPLADLRGELWMEDGFEPIYGRALHEAGL